MFQKQRVILTVSLVETFFYNIDANFVDVHDPNGDLSLALPVLRDFILMYPVQLWDHFLNVAVIITEMLSIHNTHSNKLWKR